MTSTQTTTTSSTAPRGIPPTDQPWAFDARVRRFGGLGVAGATLFGAAVVALHYLEPGMTPHDHFVSEYSISGAGLLMKAAFLALAAGVLCLALGIRASFEPGRRVRWAWSLMVVAALGYAASGVFDTDPIESVLAGEDPSWHGMLHDLSGVLAFLGTISAAFVLRGVFRRSSPWRAMAGVALLFGAALTVLLVIVLAAPAESVGVAQRAFLVVLLLWFGVVGSWMRRRTADPATEPSAALRARSARTLAVVALVGALTFAVAVAVVGLLEPGLSLSGNFVSDYALEDTGLVLTLGFLGIGTAHIALGLGLRRSLSPSRRRTYASWALVVVGVSSVLSGLFPSRLWTDPTGGPGWHQAVHETAGLLALPVVISVLVVLVGAYRRDPRWRPFAGIQQMFTVAFLVLLVVFLGAPESEIGTAQRSHQAVIVAWFAVTALALLWVSRAPLTEPEPEAEHPQPVAATAEPPARSARPSR
jgi:hypothetical membrane protein